MVRWRLTFCLLLGMLLVAPTKVKSKGDDDEEDDKHTDEEIEDDEEDDEDDDEEAPEKLEKPRSDVGKRAPAMGAPPPEPASEIKKPRAPKKKPLECYVCAYKAETPLKACLDPSKYRVHTITCHNLDDKCFTSVISKGNNYEAVVRGCRSGCIGTPETTCCELNRCNNQVYAPPMVERSVMADGRDARTAESAAPAATPTVFFFVTILLMLQSVVKVVIV